MEEKSQIFSIARQLTSTNANSFIQLYPASDFFEAGAIPYDAYLIDFFASIDISSLPDLPPRSPGDALETRDQLEWRYYQQVKEHPVKYVGIYFSEPNSGNRVLRFRFPVWALAYGYTEDLTRQFTKYEFGVLAYGSRLWARVEEGVTSTGPLSGDDKITFHLSGVESAAVESAAVDTDAWKINAGIASSASVTTTTSIVLAANPNRKVATLINRGNSIAYLNYGTAATIGAGIGLNPGGSTHVLNVREVNYTGPISAIAATGSTQLEIMEGI